MDPSGWGPYYWGMLHLAAMSNAPEFPELVQMFPGLLPCPTCSADFKKIIENTPLTGNYFMWSVDVHNQVNAKLGKPQVSYEDAQRRWTTSIKQPKVPLITIALVALFILLLLARR